MDNKEEITTKEHHTVLFEVCKWDREIHFSRTCIAYDYELESNLWILVDLSLVEHPFVVHRDFGVMTEYVGNAI